MLQLKVLFFLLHLPLQSVFSTHQFFYAGHLFCPVLPACRCILPFSFSFAIPVETKLFNILYVKEREMVPNLQLTVHVQIKELHNVTV